MPVRQILLLSTVLVVATLVGSDTPGVAQAETTAKQAVAQSSIRVRTAFMELPPTIKELRYVFACPDDLAIEMHWIAEDVGQAAPANIPIASVKHKTRGPMNIAHLSRPTNGWPLGLYRLELRHGGEVFHQVRFVIDEVAE